MHAADLDCRFRERGHLIFKGKGGVTGEAASGISKYFLQNEGEKGDFPPNFHPCSVTF